MKPKTVSVDVTLLRPVGRPRYASVMPTDPTPPDGQPLPMVDLADRAASHQCPGCGGYFARYQTGTMAYHGATRERGRRCTFPESEMPYLASLTGLLQARALWPACASVYRAVEVRLRDIAAKARAMPAHGRRLRHPDRRDPSWRWKR